MIKKMLNFFALSILVNALFACDDESVQGNVETTSYTPDCDVDLTHPSCLDQTIWHDLPDCFNDYLRGSFNDGDVIEYHWSETIAWFFEPKTEEHRHRYGFDMDPYAICSTCPDAVARGRDVYMSVKEGKTTYVTVRLDKSEKEKYRLVNISGNDEISEDYVVVNGADLCTNADEKSDRFCAKDIELSAGVYGVYHYNKDTKKYDDKQRYLHIIEYDEKTKKIDYVQFGDNSELGCVKNGVNGCYTKREVETRFNEIMAQAVVTAGNRGFYEYKPEDIGFDEYFTIDLSEQRDATEDDDNPIIEDLVDKIRKSEKYGYYNAQKKLDDSYEALDNYCRNSGTGCSIEKVITKKNVGSWKKIYDINTDYEYTYFDNDEEWARLYQTFNYAGEALKKAAKDFERNHLGLGINRMRLKWIVEGQNSDKFTLSNYPVFDEAYHMMETEKKLQVEVILDGKTSGTTATLEHLRTKDDNTFVASIGKILEKGKKYHIVAEVLPFIPDPKYKAKGDKGYNPETDGSYAAQITQPFLADCDENGKNCYITGGVAFATHLEGDASKNTMVHEIGHTMGLNDLVIREDDPTYPANYTKLDLKASFAFNESNVMAYIVPTGKRLRYRPLAIAETGTGKYQQVKENGVYILLAEKQWDCVRSSKDCIWFW